MLYKQIIERLVDNDCKITPQRKEIIKTLIYAKTHLSAKEIYARLRRKYPNLSQDTVYRNLAILKELRVVNQLDFLEGKSRYELNRDHHHYHYLVCIGCGGTWKIESCPMEYLDVQSVPKDFQVTSHRFELFGFCANCEGGRKS